MRRRDIAGRVLRTLAVSGMMLAAALPAFAQDTTLVIDGCIFWDNNGGGSNWATDSGGANCPDGAYNVADLATFYFDNQEIDPLLNPLVNDINTPRWDPQFGSPALPGHPDFRVLKASELDPWFEDVCYVGAVPFTGGIEAKDWTVGWTYYNYIGGLGRTDIDTTKTLVTIVSDVLTDTTWTNDTNIMLIGRIGVQPPATLTIEPGTVVMGQPTGDINLVAYLVIERGAKINAQGTKENPIIFTSGGRWQEGNQNPGDWGGVVIHGQAVANCGRFTAGCGLTSEDVDPGPGVQYNDCISEGAAGLFGGPDDADDSGIITYARVEYSGRVFFENDELNAWTFNAVGSETVADYLQAHLGTDDNFEWFGGTMRLKHLVSTGGDDDNVDWQMGYRGKVQFAVCQQWQDAAGATPNADAGIEADNNENDNSCEGTSRPQMANLTLIGTGPRVGGARGMRLRRGTSFQIINSIVQGWDNVGLRVESPATFDNCPGTPPSDLDCSQLAVGDNPTRTGFVVAAAPNPARGATNLSFHLPRDGNVKVQVFNVSGQLVETVADRSMTAGDHSVRWNAEGVNSGLYFYRVVTAAGDAATGKIMVR
jgi:hypothetical protein